MSPARGFEPVIPASERPRTHALDSAATGIDLLYLDTKNNAIQCVHNIHSPGRTWEDNIKTDVKKLGLQSVD
jgi:hypothetical protein